MLNIFIFLASLLMSTDGYRPEENPKSGFEPERIKSAKVKSTTVWQVSTQYDQKLRKDTLVKEKVEYHEFDKNGRQVFYDGRYTHVDYYRQGYKFFYYDRRGRLVEECLIDKDGSYYYWFEYRYDNRNNIILKTSCNSNKKFEYESYNYFYYFSDRDCKKKKVLYYNNDGKRDSFLYTYYYDKHGYLVKEYLVSGDESWIANYAYDSIGRLIEKNEFLNNHKVCSYSYFYQNNKSHNLIRLICDSSLIASYEYDETGRLARFLRYSESDSLNQEVTWKYNDKDLIVNLTYNDFLQNISVSISHDYDTTGFSSLPHVVNDTVMVWSYRNSHIETTKRVIEYSKKSDVYVYEYEYFE